MRCMTSAKYTMLADVLRQAPTSDDEEPMVGEWQTVQDPLSGEIVRVWVAAADDNPDTPTIEALTIPCEVRGIIEGGIRVAGTTERFGEEYENVDFIRMKFSTAYILSKRDRVTRIRDKRTGAVIWKEEELGIDGVDFRATVFDVLGVTPIIDALGNYSENRALLERAQLQ